MPRFYLPNEGHVVNILPPVDITGGVTTSVVFSLEDYGHADIIITMGVTGAASTVTVEECDNFTPTTHTEIAFDVYKEETAAGDTLGAKVACTVAGFATSLNNSIMYVIPIDDTQLTEGYPNVRISLSNPGVSTLASAVAILSGARYASDQSPTVIA